MEGECDLGKDPQENRTKGENIKKEKETGLGSITP